MTADTIIQAENLGKRYMLGKQDGKGMRYKTLRDTLTQSAAGSLRRLRRAEWAAHRPGAEEFWALKDVSFEIQRGEVVGIIGRNGAGKSTLLKVLSRITEPTEGRIAIRGRVASLLEVGTGFHPELTGRENIFLNGAIMGMRRAEIKAKFDEIVAFAEVEKFLDTPVKRYSSGMYVRLAFAVAAHLEPEILIIDEVLAVGDAEFQRKCMGRMEQAARGEGKTVLFVSHNMGAITQLCSRAILLSEGQILDTGAVSQVISRYFERKDNQWAEKTWPDLSLAPGNDTVRLTAVRLIDETGALLLDDSDVRRSVGVAIDYQVLREGAVFAPSLHLHNSEGIQIFLAIDLEKDWALTPRAVGMYRSTAWIPGNFLNIGMHYVGVAISRLDIHTLHLFVQQVLAFNVAESSSPDTARGIYGNSLPGAIRPILNWKTLAMAAPGPGVGEATALVK